MRFCGTCVLATLFVFLLASSLLAGDLPTFDDFRRVDRSRRLTGQLQTEELIRVTQMDGPLLIATARGHEADWEAQWGAAELLVEWNFKREFYERALAGSETNTAVALRFALAAATQREDDLAFRWLRIVEQHDKDNLVPWLVEIWLHHQQQGKPSELVEALFSEQPPSWAALFRDETSSAARARIHLLELAGYSPYAARRLGFMPEPSATVMARELSQLELAASARSWLLTCGRSMQDQPIFFLTELVGQTLELAALNMEEDRTASELRYRTAQLARRREEIKELIQVTGREAVEIASEQEMIDYFDNLLVQGEEAAMEGLLEQVQRPFGP